MSEVSITASLTIVTCREGHLWAGPNWAKYVGCPYCASTRLEVVRAQRDQYKKTISALRGQITKLRGRK